MEGPEIKATEAIIDNGKHGKRVIRFETGRLAQQAQGAAAVYLDGETMMFSATTASKQPKDQIDFFPLTIDVEEKMYAAGRIPGSFFRREGRPSTEAILACRLIDRPLRPSFEDGLRNEIQVVVTVMAIHPDELYDVVAINAASISTQLAGLPFSGPVGGVRVALIDGQWVAFPKHSQLVRAVFDMVVAGRVVVENGKEDVAIMMVEAEATDAAWNLIKNEGAQAPTEEIVAQGLEAAKPFIKELCEAQSRLAAKSAKPLTEYPLFPPYSDEVFAAVAELAEVELGRIYLIADKQARQDADDRSRRDRLAKQARLISENPDAVLAYSQARLIDAHGLWRGRLRPPLEDAGLRLDFCFRNPIPHTSAVFPLYLVRENLGGYRNCKACEDYDLCRASCAMEKLWDPRKHSFPIAIMHHPS